MSGTKWYLLSVVALFLALNVLVVLWAARAAADPLRAFTLIDALYTTVLFGGGGLTVAVLAGSRLVSDILNWRRTTWFVAGAAALTNLANDFFYLGAPGHSVLYRDIAASVTLVVVLTLVVSCLGRQLHQRGSSGLSRTAACGAVAAVGLVSIPILVIAVHCTSGDCL